MTPCRNGMRPYWNVGFILWFIYAVLAMAPMALSSSRNTKSDVGGVLKSLDTITSGFRKGSESESSLRLTGTIDPFARKFTLTRRNGKARFDIEFVRDDARIVCCRLDDGERLFKLDEDSLILDSLEDRKGQWINVTHELSQFECPLFEGRQRDVADLIEWLASAIRGQLPDVDSKQAFANGDAVCTVSDADDGRILIALDSRLQPVSSVFRLELAPRQGYRLVHWDFFDGAVDESQWRYKLSITNSYREVLPDVWVLSHGTCTIDETGSAPRQGDQPPHASMTVHVEMVDVGDFSVSDDLFSVHSLPIVKGMYVEDCRVSPHAHYRYDQDSVNASLLENALAQRDKSMSEMPPSEGKQRGRWLIALNCGALLLLGAFYWFRRRSM